MPEGNVPEIKVTSELNGMVQKLEAAPGGKVSEGDTLILLNCMKMEIPVLAPKSGTLKAILVEEGAVVAEGQTLATIET
jgi:biotin carboxyl carrier protein